MIAGTEDSETGSGDKHTPDPQAHSPSPVACILVLTTTATQAEADRLATSTVEERLAACAQVSGPVSSQYHWQGTLERSAEWRIQFKTTSGRYRALEARIKALHSYQVPEIIAVPILEGSAEYLKWIEDEVLGDR
jgi:periplasmic divalent cation tolerance protein